MPTCLLEIGDWQPVLLQPGFQSDGLNWRRELGNIIRWKGALVVSSRVDGTNTILISNDPLLPIATDESFAVPYYQSGDPGNTPVFIVAFNNQSITFRFWQPFGFNANDKFYFSGITYPEYSGT